MWIDLELLSVPTTATANTVGTLAILGACVTRSICKYSKGINMLHRQCKSFQKLKHRSYIKHLYNFFTDIR